MEEEIFESLKEIFIDTQITNHYFLQGVIKFYKLPYILRKDYLKKSDETDMAEEFEKFVIEIGEVSTQEIKKNFLQKNCVAPINSRKLFDLFFEKFPEFMARNDIQNHNKLFDVLQYMFRDDFNFSRPYISMEDIKKISNKKILLI